LSVPTIDHDVARDLDIARRLVRAGVPVFIARFVGWGNGTNGSGFQFPNRWQLTPCDEAALDTWRPGDALGAVMGTKLDLLDVDPRNGGEASAVRFEAEGLWPTEYGRAVTPSGGWHYFVAPLGVGSRDNVAPGLDHKGGRRGVPVLDAGRGFAFIAPTVKPSKVTGELVPYAWDKVPDFELVAEGLELDPAGVDLASHISSIKSTKTEKSAPTGDEPYADPKHSGPIRDGERHHALIAYASKLRGRGLSLDEAERLMYGRWLDCAQPDKPDNLARFPLPWEEAVDKLRDVFARYAAEPVRGVEAIGSAASLGLAPVVPIRPDMSATEEDEARRLEVELAFNRAVAEEAWKVRVRDEAKRRLRAETMPATPSPVALPELLAEPDVEVPFRVAEVFPANARVVLAAQRKAGKTTMTANLVRALCDGGSFLGKYETTPVGRRVTVLDFEMARHMLRSWFADVRIENAHKVTMWPLRGSAAAFDITTAPVRRQWAERLGELETDVLVLDCLRPILDAIGLDEKSEAGRFLVALDELLADAGIPECLLVHHAGHAGERSRGDSRLRDWPDAEWRLVREKAETDGEEPGPDAKRFFSAEGRDVAVAEAALDFDPITRRLLLVGGNRKASKIATHYPRILAFVGLAANVPEGAPGYTQSQIEEGLSGEIGRAAVRQALGEMAEKGMLARLPGPRKAAYYVLSGPIQIAGAGLR
jgi:hypothetical protein